MSNNDDKLDDNITSALEVLEEYHPDWDFMIVAVDGNDTVAQSTAPLDIMVPATLEMALAVLDDMHDENCPDCALAELEASGEKKH